MQTKQDTKPPITTKLPKTESIYLLTTNAGQEHIITKDNYEQIKKLWADGENYGIFIVNANTEDEATIPMRNIDSISRGSRTEAA